MAPDSDDSIPKAVAKIGIGSLERHIFLCVGDECCADDAGAAAWEHLKKRLKECGLAGPERTVARTKAGCLRICTDGPIGVVYPDGTWYRRLNPGNIDRVIEEHLLGGKPVRDLLLATDDLHHP